MDNIAFLDGVYPINIDFFEGDSNSQDMLPSVGMLSYEWEKRGHFKQIILSSLFKEEKTADFTYLPPSLAESGGLNLKPKPVYFNRPLKPSLAFKTIFDRFMHKNESQCSILENLIRILLSECFNCTVIVGSSILMSNIFQCLIKNSFKPNFFVTGQKLRLIEIKPLHVKFVCRVYFWRFT